MASVFWDGDNQTINSERYVAQLVLLKEEIAKKMTPYEEDFSPRQCKVSQVDENDA